jgi:aminopeptidase N
MDCGHCFLQFTCSKFQLPFYSQYGPSLISLLFNRTHDSATADDLFAALQEEADAAKLDLNVISILESWTKQAGYPLITAHRKSDGIHITQVSQIPNSAAFTIVSSNGWC